MLIEDVFVSKKSSQRITRLNNTYLLDGSETPTLRFIARKYFDSHQKLGKVKTTGRKNAIKTLVVMGYTII